MDITTGPGDVVRTFRHFHLFCGLGGGAKGINRAMARLGKTVGRWECCGGVDVSPSAIRNFEKLAGVAGTVLDMFSREQYIAFHGAEPPAGWREATSADLQRAAGGIFPDAIVLSAPCKGFSGLLAERLSLSPKYQALNQLTLRGIWLTLEAFKDHPPKFFVFENVPRIQKRGRHLLDQIVGLLRAYGYAVAETTHDCGRLGGLAQTRKRFLLLARHTAQVPPFLYEPPQRPLRGVGEVLERLPMPGDPSAGPMHRMPALQWQTWVRLAFVRPGSDWRSLNDLQVENGVLRDYGIVPDGRWRDDILGILPWSGTAGTITGNAGPTTGRYSVADPREPEGRHRGVLGVKDWDEPAGTVTSNGRPATGPFSVADPRADAMSERGSNFGVRNWDQPAPTVTSQRSPGQGQYSVADPRVDGHEKSVQMGVRNWDQPASVVTGKMYVGGGPNSVADPRPRGNARFNNVYRIVRFGDPSPAVTGGGAPSAGGLAVADPRPPGHDSYKQVKYKVTAYDGPANAVIGASTTGQGAFALADPRTGFGPGTHHNVLKVQDWDGTAGTVTGASHPSGGALSVADPRMGSGPNAHTAKMAVVDFNSPSRTVTGSDRVGSGALSVADPRPDYLRDGREAYLTGGMYGVHGWQDTAGAVAAAGQHDNGRWSVADPRDAEGGEAWALPAPTDRLVAVIRALDGTWHRPFTTLELAALQSLVDPEEFLVLDGQSDSEWREQIGNAIPPDAMEAVGTELLRTLLLAEAGETFQLSNTPIWVRNVAVALSVAPGPYDGMGW